MVLVQGHSIDEIWYGKVVKIDRKSEIVFVSFFIKSKHDVSLFERESVGRASINCVSVGLQMVSG